jgi:hypothetical protein
MTCNFYYNPTASSLEQKIVDKNWVAFYGGIDPDTSTPVELAGFLANSEEELENFQKLEG